MPRFSAVIYKIGINPVVDPPESALKALFAQAGKSRGPIGVRGTLNGAQFVQTLVKYRGAWRLYINGPMLKLSGLDVGDTAKVEIEFDPSPRDVAIPGKLVEALGKDPIAKTAFGKLSPSRQKEISKYLGSLKTVESIDRNVARIMHHLRGDETDAQYALMRRNKTSK